MVGPLIFRNFVKSPGGRWFLIFLEAPQGPSSEKSILWNTTQHFLRTFTAVSQPVWGPGYAVNNIPQQRGDSSPM